MKTHRYLAGPAAACAAIWMASAASGPAENGLSGQFRWHASAPLVRAEDRDGDQYHAIKDPSVVRYKDRWHVFCTLRGKNRSHQIEYLSFKNWSEIGKARRVTLRLTDGFFCAPQVFYFRPHKKWYLIYQVVDKSRTPELQPAFSTTTDITDPASWTPPKLLVSDPSKGVKNWLDFWIICDAQQAHLFFTTLNGRMLRSDAPVSSFPGGWDQARVVLQDDIYEASHTYRLKGANKYMTFVEAQAPAGRRYFKAYIADDLAGAWKPLAADKEKAFAVPGNVRFDGEPWTESFSHGELIREGYDESLTVDPARMVLLFQGVCDRDREAKPYGQIPWKLGLLRAVR